MRRISLRVKQRLFSEFEMWGVDHRGWSSHTRRKYRGEVERCDRWLVSERGIPILRAKPEHLKDFLFSLKCSVRSRNAYAQALIAFGTFLVEKAYWDVNYALSLPRVKVNRPLPKAVPTKFRPALETAAKALGPRTFALTVTFLYTGLRINEVRLLQWPSIDIDGGWLSAQVKGGQERRVPLHPKVIAALGFWKARCEPSRWVWPSPVKQDAPIAECTIRKAVREVGKQVGVPNLHPHMFRHTFASQLVANEVHIRVVQEALGHADLRSTQVYTSVEPLPVKKAVMPLDFTRKGA